jgi:hypothetical protein
MLNPIPWLVQVAHPGETHARPEWEPIAAANSQGAVVVWLETHDHTLPITIRVAPSAAVLRHPNGMPMMSREFTVTAEMPAAHARLLSGETQNN